MLNKTEDKVFFVPGMKVQVKLDIPNKPVMVVVKKETSMFKHEDNILKGIKCMWFTTTGELKEHIFNTKDLQVIE